MVTNAGHISDWQTFYRNVFDINVDLSGIKIPEKAAGFDRLIVVIPEMTMRNLFEKCDRMFGVWKYFSEGIDDDFVRSERKAAKGAYAIWVKDAIDSDEELKNISKKEFGAKAFYGMTLPERLLMELKFHNETGGHLDPNSATICSGSNFSSWKIPMVFWDGEKVAIDWAELASFGTTSFRSVIT
ncbi:MAG: hypothetical protein WC788_07425 [Candidatus Paceibacterota bacterium]|jgi:hypothetical protein